MTDPLAIPPEMQARLAAPIVVAMFEELLAGRDPHSIEVVWDPALLAELLLGGGRGRSGRCRR